MRRLIALIVPLVVVGVGCYLIYVHLGKEDLSALGSYLTGIGTVLLGSAALYAGLEAVREYKTKAQTDKARWTTDLFHKFYEERAYRTIRQKIDYDDLSHIRALIHRREGKFSQDERDLFDNFTDYLNFFEYVAYLLEQNQLDRADVEAMFEYYLKRMAESTELGDYARDNGFERLHTLLLKYGLKA